MGARKNFLKNIPQANGSFVALFESLRIRQTKQNRYQFSARKMLNGATFEWHDAIAKKSPFSDQLQEELKESGQHSIRVPDLARFRLKLSVLKRFFRMQPWLQQKIAVQIADA